MTEESSQHQHILISPEQSGQRLDAALALQTGLTRARIQSLLKDCAIITQTGSTPKASYKVQAGEEYNLTIPALKPSLLVPSPSILLHIAYEDEDILVIDKQAGLTVHPGAGQHQDTLANALLHHCKGSLSGIGGVERPGIVHRLDKDTSGLLVIAKHDEAHRHLSEQLQTRRLKRIYHALVWNIPSPAEGTIHTRLDRHPKDRTKRTVVKTGGKSATTDYQTLRVLLAGKAALVECTLDTGRTHQIRVHMQHIRTPIISDPVYSPPLHGKFLQALPQPVQQALSALTRQALHAHQLTLIHPKTGEEMTFQSPLGGQTSQDIGTVMKAMG